MNIGLLLLISALIISILSNEVNAQANSSVYCENVLKGIVCGIGERCAGDTDSLEGNVTCCFSNCTGLATGPGEEKGVQFEASYIEELPSAGAYTLYGIAGVIAIFVFIFIIIILTSKRTGKK